MADREKIIASLSNALVQMHGCGRYTPEDVDELETAAWKALELLEEQECEGPLIIHKDEIDDVYDYIAECPECGMTWAMWHSEKMRYCPGCGRAVKWDG